MFKRFFSFAVFAVLLSAVHSGHASEAVIGIAKVDITPPLGEPMGGYAERISLRSTEVHDKVFARAMSFQTQSELGILISADLLLIPRQLKGDVEKRIRERLPQLTWLSISASHTHYSVGGYMNNTIAELAVAGPYSDEIYERLVSQLVNVAIASSKNQSPMQLAFIEVPSPKVSQNRRHKGGVRDETLRALVFSNGEHIKAVWVNFAIHSTLMPHRSTAISGDIAGATQNTLEKVFPEAITMFLNAGLGDQGPKDVPVRNWQAVNEMGEAIATSVIEAQPQLSFEPLQSLEFLAHSFSLPKANLKWSFSCFGGLNQLFPILGANMFHGQGELQGMQLNQTLVLFSPGEVAVEVQQQIENTFPEKQVLVVALANDYWGYVLTPEDFSTGGYESCMNFYGPQFSHRLRAEFERMVR